MVFATQHATTTTGFSYGVIHPSNANIRFIGCDNSSDGVRLLRVDGVNNSNARLVLHLGNLTANMNKTFTAAFGIVNEEKLVVNITHITVTNTSGSANYLKIWLHGNRSLRAEDDPTGVLMFDNGSVVNDSSTTAWVLNKGDGDPSGMNASGVSISTPWDETAHVRYSTSSVNATDDGLSDFVWVQISLNIPANAVGDSYTGTIFIHFEASTHWDTAGTSEVGFQGVASWASGPTGAGNDYGYGVAVDSNGNVYITGYHGSGLDFGGGVTVADEGYYGVFVAKYV